MSKSRRLSSASAQCPPLRIEWRPSRHGALALWLLTLLAPFSLLASGLPTGWALALGAPVLLAGVRMTRRYARAPLMPLVIPAGLQPACRDTRPIAGLQVHWRGPLAFLHWRQDGQSHRIVFFPDTLQAPARRALKLALQRRNAAAPGQATLG